MDRQPARLMNVADRTRELFFTLPRKLSVFLLPPSPTS
jgi:hypothetical protein